MMNGRLYAVLALCGALLATRLAAQRATFDFASAPTEPQAAYTRLAFWVPQAAGGFTAGSGWGTGHFGWSPVGSNTLRFRAELEGVRAPADARRDSLTAYGGGLLGLAAHRGRGRAWVAVGAGDLRDDLGSRLVGRGTLGGSFEWRHLALTLTLAGAQIPGGTRTYTYGSSPGVDTLGVPPAPPVVSRQVVPGRAWRELSSSVFWSQGPVALQLMAGVTTLPGQTIHWLRTDAALSIRRDVALVAGLGNAPLPVIGVRPPVPPFALGLRVALGHATALSDAPRTHETAEFAVLPYLGKVRRIRLEVPSAQHVELTADFINWRVLPLSYIGSNVWETTLPIGPGNHQVSIRMNGGPWQAPPGLKPVEDDFGGGAGLLHVD